MSYIEVHNRVGCCGLLQTHSAYMLFYERMKAGEAVADALPPDTADSSTAMCRLDADDDDRHTMKIELSPDLAEVVFCCSQG